MYQGDQHTRAAGADGVAEGNGATVYVHPRPIPVEFPAVGQGLGVKCFVDLDEVEIANLHACALKQALNSTRGGCEDIAWGDGCRSVAGDTRHDCQAVSSGKVLVDYNRGRSAIAQAGSIACCDCAALFKDRHEPGQGIHRAVAANRLIAVNHQDTLLLLDFNGYNFFLESASSSGSGSPLVTL